MKHLVVGLTGGIGSGKTAAADHFAELGAAVIDADAIAHELTRPGGAAIPLIKQAFGAEAIATDGAMDRIAVRRLVFANPELRRQLESILHPMIHAAGDAKRNAAFSAGADYAVMVVPLLVESGNFRGRFDRIAVVDCPEELQIQRVMARNNFTAEEVKAVMSAQADRQARLAAADDVIDNSADLATLYGQVDALHEMYRAIAGK